MLLWLMEESSLHKYVCLHECLRSFQHYAAYRKIDLQRGAEEEMISKEVTYHDPF